MQRASHVEFCQVGKSRVGKSLSSPSQIYTSGIQRVHIPRDGLIPAQKPKRRSEVLILAFLFKRFILVFVIGISTHTTRLIEKAVGREEWNLLYCKDAEGNGYI